MEKVMQIFAIVVIAMYFIFIGVLVYEFIEMWDDHECWMIKVSGETDKKCEEKYGLK
jgi:hypothetical protein